jgi:outer membrane protein assembly factor BamB
MRPSSSGTAWLLTYCLLLRSVSDAAETWGQFRGENGGVAKEAKLPLEWSVDKNVLWKIRLSGVGWSQPVGWGDKIFVTTAVSEGQHRPDAKDMSPGIGGISGFLSSGGGMHFKPPEENYQWKLLCLNATTGKMLWEKTARAGKPAIHIHPNNTYATETPVTDGERVVAYFGMTGVYAYDLDGILLWSKELEAYPTQFGWGTGSSPVIYGDHVFIQCDNDQSSFLLALDKRTGEEAWRAERDELSSWSTPYIWRNRLRTELVTAGGNWMRSYDPATGKLLWQLKGDGRTASTPTSDSDLLYLDSYSRLTGVSGNLRAVKPGGDGDITPPPGKKTTDFVAWSAELSGGRVASPIVCEGLLYEFEQQAGVVRCLDAKTGKQHFRKRVPEAAGFTASPIAVGQNIYSIDHGGRTFVIKAQPQLNMVAANALGEMCWASPSVVAGRLVIRTVDNLYCLGESSPETQNR